MGAGVGVLVLLKTVQDIPKEEVAPDNLLGAIDLRLMGELRGHEHGEYVEELDLHDGVAVMDGITEGNQDRSDQEMRDLSGPALDPDCVHNLLEEVGSAGIDRLVVVEEGAGDALGGLSDCELQRHKEQRL